MFKFVLILVESGLFSKPYMLPLFEIIHFLNKLLALLIKTTDAFINLMKVVQEALISDLCLPRGLPGVKEYFELGLRHLDHVFIVPRGVPRLQARIHDYIVSNLLGIRLVQLALQLILAQL